MPVYLQTDCRSVASDGQNNASGGKRKSAVTHEKKDMAKLALLLIVVKEI